ncbi:MAG: aldo/keto reductase [Myxococcota bacterium]
MKYRRLGQTGLNVSTVCFGAMTFGEADDTSFMHKLGTPEDETFRLIDMALDAGCNFIDTADVYGQDGLSERVLGRYFETRGRRNEAVLATKFRFTMGEGPNRQGASRHRVIECCEASLKRLKTDHIDLYQIHMQDNATPEEETLRALDDLVRSGKVRYIGCSNYAAYRLVNSLWTSQTRGLASFVSLQAQYSLVERNLEREHIPACREHGLGVLPWSPLAGGFLTGKYRKDQAPEEGSRFEKWKERYAKFTDRHWAILEATESIAKEMDATIPQVALAWLLHQPTVSSVIFGARTQAQLEDNLKAAELELSDASLAVLDEASRVEWGYPYDFMGRIMGSW